MHYYCIKQHDITDCGAACLATISKQYGLKTSISRIREVAGTDKQGTTALGVIKAAEQLDFTAKGVKGDQNAFFSEFPLPAIAHVIVDGKLLHYVVTTASVHDVNVFVHLVCLAFTTVLAAGLSPELLIVYADSGYTGSKYTELLAQMWNDMIVHVIKRAVKDCPLRGWEKSYNVSVSSIRCRVEHVFGAMTNDMGGIHTRTIGLERNTRDIVAKSLAYNIKRAAYLFSKAAA